MEPEVEPEVNPISELQLRLRSYAQERDWEQFHSPKNLSAALAVEASELLEHFQWLTEAQSATLSADKKEAVAMELADVFLYTLRLADRLQIDLLVAVDRKFIINEQRYPAEKVRGSAKKYHEYDQEGADQ